MSSCTFFGHRDAPDTVRPHLQAVVKRLILEEKVTRFYVGNHGAFDRMVYSVLLQMHKQYPHIHIAVVLAYMPSLNDARYGENSVFPEELEFVPKRFAIHYRNEWMLCHADYVVSYVTRGYGGAARYVDKARKQHKKIIGL